MVESTRVPVKPADARIDRSLDKERNVTDDTTQPTAGARSGKPLVVMVR